MPIINLHPRWYADLHFIRILKYGKVIINYLKFWKLPWTLCGQRVEIIDLLSIIRQSSGPSGADLYPHPVVRRFVISN